MGQQKSKHHFQHGAAEEEKGSAAVAELQLRRHAPNRRKWRKKQGYSLPAAMAASSSASSGMIDQLGSGGSVTNLDLPDLDLDDAVLVSYSQSNVETLAHLRPKYTNRKQMHLLHDNHQSLEALASLNQIVIAKEPSVVIVHDNEAATPSKAQYDSKTPTSTAAGIKKDPMSQNDDDDAAIEFGEEEDEMVEEKFLEFDHEKTRHFFTEKIQDFGQAQQSPHFRFDKSPADEEIDKTLLVAAGKLDGKAQMSMNAKGAQLAEKSHFTGKNEPGEKSPVRSSSKKSIVIINGGLKEKENKSKSSQKSIVNIANEPAEPAQPVLDEKANQVTSSILDSVQIPKIAEAKAGQVFENESAQLVPAKPVKTESKEAAAFPVVQTPTLLLASEEAAKATEKSAGTRPKSSADIVPKQTDALSPNISADIHPKISADTAPKQPANGFPKKSADISHNLTADIATKKSIEIVPKKSADISDNLTADIATKKSIEIVPKKSADISHNLTTDIGSKNSVNIVPNKSADIKHNLTADIRTKNSVDIVPKKSADIHPMKSADVIPKQETEQITKKLAELSPKQTADFILKKSAELSPKQTADLIFKNSAELSPKQTADFIFKKSAEASPGSKTPKITADMIPKQTADIIPKETADIIPQQTKDSSHFQNLVDDFPSENVAADTLISCPSPNLSKSTDITQIKSIIGNDEKSSAAAEIERPQIAPTSVEFIDEPNLKHKDFIDEMMAEDGEISPASPGVDPGPDFEVLEKSPAECSISIYNEHPAMKILQKKKTTKLRDLDDYQSANLIDDDDDNLGRSLHRPQIDCDVLNSTILEEENESSEEDYDDDSCPNLDFCVHGNTEKMIPKIVVVEDEEENQDDIYHSRLVTTCVDDSDEEYDLRVPNESWIITDDHEFTSCDQRPQPVGCSSDSHGSSRNSEDLDNDSLEDIKDPVVIVEEKKKRRSLPAIPVDHSLQQQRAYEILRQKLRGDEAAIRMVEGHEESELETELEANPDSGCASLEPAFIHNNENKGECLKSGMMWVGLDPKNEDTVRRPKNHERLKKSSRRHSAPPGSLENLCKNAQKHSSRIHSAVVSGINIDTRSVTVEWFERGETKGKEVELETLLSLNQDLAPVSNNDNNGINNKLGKIDRSSMSQTRSYVPRPSITPNHRGSTTTAASTTGASTRAMGRAANKAVRQTMNGLDLQQQAGEEKQQNGSSMDNDNKSSISTKMDLNSETVSKGTGAKARSIAAEDRRRSNVVKEIDRLKKNREERRAKQQEILEEKSAQRNIDPGNPNWEFMCMIRDYQEQLEFNPLQDGDDISEHQITVCVRKRPLNKKEKARKDVDVITCPNKDQVIIHEPKTKVDLTKYLDNQHFRFDYVFEDSADNNLVYKYSARPLVQNIFEGGMATCFAYGQTGSGKTHTMGGEFHGKTQDSKNGIYALATKDVFTYLKSPKYKHLKLQVSCSYFEIYSGKVFDLLSGKSKLRVLEDGKQQVVVVGLTETVVNSVEDVLKLITSGNNLRTSGQTSANSHSSRSHAVFQIILRANTAKKPLHGKFSLIDLAGNERGADTSSANRQTRMEGAEINKSLLALKECIRALGRKGGHLPFRASKLTQVLRDSFIGEKSKTCMIAMVSPSLNSCEHTLNTLRYADRVKELGAVDPAEQAKSSPTEGSGPEGMRLDDGVMSPEDSDLAQLRSLNEGELSADWYNFQEAISHLQALEEELVESHKTTIQNMLKWTKEDASLLAMTNEVDYDQDAYCQQLEDMITEKMEAFHDLREKARNFRTCLRDEEAKSQLLMHRNY